MQPRFNLCRTLYDIKKGSSWPKYDDFLILGMEEIVPLTIRNEIQSVIDIDPKYHKSMLPLLKQQFAGLDEIAEHYSQAWQDLFVLTMLNGKRNGTYLEIGAFDPIYISNTYLLEKFGYTGISIDILENPNWGMKRPKSKYIQNDATIINYTELLKEMPNQIDYLQLDIDPEQSILEVLKILPHDKYRFSVITYETDVFRGDLKTRDTSREILTSLGYEMVVDNVGVKDYSLNSWLPFEDWWVDPTVIDRCIIDSFKSFNDINLAHQIFFKD